MTQHIEKIFCDICKKEIDLNAEVKSGEFLNQIDWSRKFYVKNRNENWVTKNVRDVCKECYTKICELQTELWNAFNKDEGD